MASEARRLPVGGGLVMSRQRLLDVIDRMRVAVPREVYDARDVLENPERILRLLCDAVGVDFMEAMLSWPPGLRETDGIWAKHWYFAQIVISPAAKNTCE